MLRIYYDGMKQGLSLVLDQDCIVIKDGQVGKICFASLLDELCLYATTIVIKDDQYYKTQVLPDQKGDHPWDMYQEWTDEQVRCNEELDQWPRWLEIFHPYAEDIFFQIKELLYVPTNIVTLHGGEEDGNCCRVDFDKKRFLSFGDNIYEKTNQYHANYIGPKLRSFA